MTLKVLRGGTFVKFCCSIVIEKMIRNTIFNSLLRQNTYK